MASRKPYSLKWAACAALGTLSVGLSQSAWALQTGADSSSAPTTQVTPAATQATDDAAPMKVIVAAVEGRVQVRKSPNDPWAPATVGMELSEGAEFRTGMRSSVRCQIPPDQEFIIDRLTTTRVSEAIKQGGVIKTDLSMKYGRTQYSIQAAGAQHEATIRSPSSTLAVRGTVVSLYDQPPFTPEARSFVGRAVYRDAKKQVAVGSPTRGGRILANRADPADTALSETVVDPVYAAARTNSEAQFVAQETSRGGIVGFNQRLGITTVSNSAPFTDEQLSTAVFPGELNFVLRWSGNANLDLTVLNQYGNPNQILGIPPFPPLQEGDPGYQPEQVLYPGFGLDINNGGRIPFNHLGGPSGGQEVASFTPAKAGIYTFQVINVKGATANAKFNIFLRGQPQGITGVPKVDANGNPVTYTLHIDLGDGTIFDQPGTPVLEGQIPLTDANGNQLFDRLGNPLFRDTFDPDLNPNPDPPPSPKQIERMIAEGKDFNFVYFLTPDALGEESQTPAQRKAAEKAKQAAAKAERLAAKRELKATKEAAAQARANERKIQDAAARAAKAQKALEAKAAKELRVAQKAVSKP